MITINIEQCRIVVKTYGKSAILMKRTQSYPFSYESYLHLLLSLPCIMPLHLYYVLLDQTFNLFSFLTSRIKQWTPAIEINKSNKSKIKNLANWLAQSIFWHNPK